MGEICYVESSVQKIYIASTILTQLPDWFGLPDSTKAYIEESTRLPFWAYFDEDEPIGFLSLKETSPYTVEICVMGVLKANHRKGIGTLLLNACEAYAKQKGYEYIQVKTVQKGHYEEYDQTNAFYEKMGFRELECFPTLWDEWNPCQIYVKGIIPMKISDK